MCTHLTEKLTETREEKKVLADQIGILRQIHRQHQNKRATSNKQLTKVEQSENDACTNKTSLTGQARS